MTPIKRLAFAGTPEFAAAHLRVLIDQGYDICAVFTQPDRPKGRGQKAQASPVKTLALQAGLTVYQPNTLKADTDYHARLAALAPDLLIVVAYGLILPVSFLTIAGLGSWNVHASLLPRWRGAAPIQRAILAGDRQTGITIMQMDAGLDTGDMLLKNTCAIEADDTTQSLQDKLQELGPQTLLQALRARTSLLAEKQIPEAASYAHKLKKTEARIDWQESAVQIDRQIRAFYPWPIAETHMAGQTIRVWQARLLDGVYASEPGTIIQMDKDAIQVTANPGIIALLRVQLPNKKPLSIRELMNGQRFAFQVGDCFEH